MRDLFWQNKISFAEEAIGNIIKSSYKSTAGSVHIVDKYLHSLII